MNTIIRKIGDEEGVILPKEVLRRLGLAAGDSVSIVETPDGLTLARGDPEFERQMAAARKGMRQYREALAKLAK